MLAIKASAIPRIIFLIVSCFLQGLHCVKKNALNRIKNAFVLVIFKKIVPPFVLVCLLFGRNENDWLKLVCFLGL